MQDDNPRRTEAELLGMSDQLGETETVDKMGKRVEHDPHYIESWSLWLDVKILLLTVLATVAGRNHIDRDGARRVRLAPRGDSEDGGDEPNMT